jgi:hypothetical protein
MKRPSTLAALLRAIERDTKGYVEQCEYILMAGPHPAYRLRQMKRKAGRQLAAIHRGLALIQERAATDDTLFRPACRLRVLTELVLDECDHFPRDAEWAGDAALARQAAVIEALIQQGRRR